MKTLREVLFGLTITVMFLAAAALALGIGTMVLFMAPEKRETVTVDIPDTGNQLVIQEYVEFRSGYFDIYLNVPGRMGRFLKRGDFNEPFCPIGSGAYEIEFDGNSATLYYPFSANTNRDDWTEIRLDLTP